MSDVKKTHSPDHIQIEHRRISSTGTLDDGPTTPYHETGAPINRSPTAELISRAKPQNAGLLWPRIRHAMREPMSEFIGTFILIMFGDGVVAHGVLSKGTHGDYQSISWGWVSCLLGDGGGNRC